MTMAVTPNDDFDVDEDDGYDITDNQQLTLCGKVVFC